MPTDKYNFRKFGSAILILLISSFADILYIYKQTYEIVLPMHSGDMNVFTIGTTHMKEAAIKTNKVVVLKN